MQPSRKSKFQRNCLTLGVLFLSLSLAGCGYMGYQRYAWDSTDKALLGVLTVTSAADAYTTMEGMDQGLRELNPILGSHPSDAEIALFTAGVVLGGWYLAQHMEPKDRKMFLTILSFIKGGAALHNYQMLE